MFPAFKEWQVIVEALGAGEQILILRKGGLAEGRRGLDAERARHFWLFPTQFHAQREKTKPAAARWFPANPADSISPVNSPLITLSYFAEVTQHRFLEAWPEIAALDPFHHWTEAAVREKYDWSRPPGLHAFVVRVYRLDEPLTLPLTPEMSGCKSWIDLPADFSAVASAPVLGDARFESLVSELGLET